MADSRTAPPAGDRLAKVIARSGLCSRRDAELWIAAGRVTVNGKTVKTPAFNVTERDKITVDGAPLADRQGTRVWLYHKPAGLVVTEKDPEGRTTVFETLAQHGLPRVVSIGRLDINTEGLLLLTNDGGLKRVLELPATGWLRRYRVRAHGTVTQAQLDKLKDGIEIDGIKYGSIEATLERPQGSNVWLLVALREGKNREVKNVLGALGLEVNRLIRVSYGPFQLGDLPVGAVETVKARVLRDQLGKRLAEEAEVDFDSEMPEMERPASVKARPLRDRESGRGTNTVEIAQQRFRFTDRAEKTPDEVRAERPRQDRPGRSDTYKPRAPKKDEDGDAAPERKVLFEDGRSETFVKKTYGAKPKRPKPGEDRPAGRGAVFTKDGPTKPFRKSGDRPEGGSGKRPYGDRAEGGAAKRTFGDRPRTQRPAGDRPTFAKDRKTAPRRDYAGAAEGPKRPNYGDKPRSLRTDGERPRSARPARSTDAPERSSRPAGPGGFAGKPRTARPRPEGERPRAPRTGARSDAGPARSGDRPARKPFVKREGAAPSRGPRPAGSTSSRGPRSFSGPKKDGPPRGPRPGSGPKKPRPPRS
jgi:23S rRNA pseudouridine2605 synthase